MLVYLCVTIAVAWIVLWVVRPATKDKPSGLSVCGRNLEMVVFVSVVWRWWWWWWGDGCLLDEPSPSGDYADVLETVKG